MPYSPQGYASILAGSGNTPSNQAIGDTASVGTSALAALSDHKHGMPEADTPENQSFSDTAAKGVSVKVALADHKHGMPGNPVSYGANPSTQAFSDSAYAGLSSDLARIDHKHAMPANPIAHGATPSTQAFGDSPNAGVNNQLARIDHKHGMPSQPSALSFASVNINGGDVNWLSAPNSGQDVWVDADLSAYCPAGSKYVVLEIYQTNGYTLGLRKKGSGFGTWSGNCAQAMRYMTIELDANRYIEQSANGAGVLKYRVQGYWT
jgi:hypothetical protein